MRPLSWWRPALPAACLVVLALAAPAPAEAPGQQALDHYLYTSLRHVINVGVDLYNAGKVEECYNHFRQSLEDLVPVLAGHPDLQKLVKDGLQKAETDPVWRVQMAARATLPNPQTAAVERQKAFALREIFNEVRANLKAEGKTTAKAAAPTPAGGGNVKGRVTLDGRPVANGTVTLGDSAGKTHAADIAPDGTFTLTDVPAGPYKVTVTGAGKDVPAAYADAKTTPITTNVTGGMNVLNLDVLGAKKPAP